MPPNTTTEVISMIAVPRAVDTSSATFSMSVFLAPQLSGGTGTLDGTDFENWPDTLAGYAAGDSDYQPAYWDVLLTDSKGNTLYEHEVYLDASGTSAALWASMFPSGTTYEDSGSTQQAARARQQSSSVDDFSAIPIISYPVKQISEFTTGQYQHYSPTEVPDLQRVASVYAPVTGGLVGVSGQQHQDALARERQARSRGGTVSHANDLTSASTSTAFAAYDEYQTPDTNPPPPGVGTVDFHAALTYIGQHGVLQRALGLVFDLEVPYYNDPTLNGPVFGGGTLNSDVYLSVYLYSYPTASAPGQSVKVNGGSAVSRASGRFGFSQVSPRTQCDADSTTFSAHSQLGGIVGGVLLGGKEELVYVPPHDVDSAANAGRSFAHAIATATSPKKETAMSVVARSAASDTSDVPDANSPAPPPSLQSGGLSLAKVNAGFDLSTQINQAYYHLYLANYAVEHDDPRGLEDFWAEDLVRGYVLDVYDATYGVWCSTCERNVTYTSGSTAVSGPTSEPFDEAPVQMAPRLVRTSRVSPVTGSGEVLLALNEIMLSYKGWSNAVPRPGKALVDQDSTLPQTDPTPQFNLTIAQSVPDGRLPPLRFGHSYSMRARVIDVANNKPPTVDPDDDSIRTPARPYGRLEPIPSPDLFPQTLPRPSESLKRMVIRDIDVDTPSVRAMYPQRVSEPFAETHGMFDNDDVPQSSAYGTIVPRESGKYPDPPTDATTQPPTIPLDQPVPYLPDPLVRGAALTFTADNGAKAVANVDFSPQNGASWPDYRPFGIEVVAGSALTTSVDTNRRVITFTLTPADDVTVTLSATCDPADVPLLGMPQLFTVSGPPDPAQVAGGAYWAVTPSINLELVYAVQKPLATPEFQFSLVERHPGQLDAYVYGRLAWSPKSTAEVDIVAAWSEPVDDPAQDLLQGPGTPHPELRHTSNSPVATVKEGNLVQAGGGSEIKPPAGDQLKESDPLSFKHLFVDTKHRVVTYSGVASTRFAECYPEGTPETVSTVHPVTVSIPSSAQPEPPSITGVVPIYDWRSTDTGGTIISERGPSGLRVFLARPWWTSGIGELLGVLTSAADEGAGDFAIAGDSDVSDWAADPVFASHSLPSRHPRESSFPDAVRFGAVRNPALRIAGHEVAFDAKRDTWYCDIKIDTGSAYTPMVRLALARWQPDSVSGLELSKVVMTQIMSLEPGRTLTVVRGSGRSLSSVQLTGYSYTEGAGVLEPGIAQVQVERRDSSIGDEELGWELVGDPVQMSHSRRGAFTVWTARSVPLVMGGQHRLVVTQYEMLPTDRRTEVGQPNDFTYSLPDPGREYRVVHQDIVPL
jgi:hypothetical protein